MPRNECGQSRCRASVTFAKLALITLVVLTGAFLFPSVQAKVQDRPYNPDDFTRVYEFTYDEVFQAAQQTFLRIGADVKEQDKEKGIIRLAPNVEGNATEVHIEQISPKPEIRVTIDVPLYLKGDCPFHPKEHCPGTARAGYALKFFNTLQKVLATYQ